MNIDHISKQQSKSFVSPFEVATKQSEDSVSPEMPLEKSFVEEESEFPERQPCSAQYPEGRKGQTFNDLFADFLFGINFCDDAHQHDAWDLLMRKATSVARRLGISDLSASVDCEQTTIDCLLKEVQKYANLTVGEIAQHLHNKKFAYIKKALKDDYIDEIRKSQRRRELNVDWDDSASSALISESGQNADAHQITDSMESHYDHQSMAKHLQKAASKLPLGPSAISETLADLFSDFELLREYADLKLSDTECKSRFVEYVAKRRGVGDQVVRRDVKRFKDNCDCPEYVQVLDILRGKISLPLKHAPRITAPATPKPLACPLPAEIQARPIWADGGGNSNSWSSRCFVCDARVDTEGDYCWVCYPEDAERRFQLFCWADRYFVSFS